MSTKILSEQKKKKKSEQRKKYELQLVSFLCQCE